MHYPYVQSWSRGNKNYSYFRRRGCPRIPLPQPYGGKAFQAVYAASLAGSPLPKSNKQSTGKLISDLVAHYKNTSIYQSLAPGSKANYDGVLGFIGKECGIYPVEDMRPENVHTLLGRARERSPSFPGRLLKVLKVVFATATETGFCKNNPVKEIKKKFVAYKEEDRDVWTISDIEQYSSFWRGKPTQSLALKLFAATGQRTSDVCRIGPEHIINGSLEITQVKTHKEIIIPLEHDLLEELARMKTRGGPFLRNKVGAAFSANLLSSMFSEWSKEAGLPAGYTAHGVRHFVGTSMAENGASTHEIMAVLGHTSLSQVERYTKKFATRSSAASGIAKVRKVQK